MPNPSPIAIWPSLGSARPGNKGTEGDIPAELVKMSIPQTDIVVGFHSLFKRQFIEYAVS
jgi:hypothetical protein